MKKKAIEKIPYLTAKKVKKKVDFVAVVARKNVDHVQHLFVEVYENKKSKLEIPKVRIVLTKKDYGTYWPETEDYEACWSQQRIHDEYNRDIWEKALGSKGTFISETDEKKVQNFCENRTWDKQWVSEIYRHQESIRNRREQVRRKNKMNRCRERNALVPELPEGFEDWYAKELFRCDNTLYYKRDGRKATITCSHCGATYTYAIEPAESFESWMCETTGPIPKHGLNGICKKCGTLGKYAASGRTRDVFEIKKKCYVVQPYKETDVVVRYLEVEKILRKKEAECFDYTEIARTFFTKGKDPMTDYHLWSPYSGSDEWRYHNLGGYQNIILEPGRVYKGSYQLLKGTRMQYSGMELYEKNAGKVKAAKYLSVYQKEPYIEMFLKLGLYPIAEQIVDGWKRVIKNKFAKAPHEVLGIKKERLKSLIRSKGNLNLLDVYQEEAAGGYQWTMEQCEKLSRINFDLSGLSIAMQHMSMQKFLNRIEKYTGCAFETARGNANAQLAHIATTYLDYLRMREELGYDLGNTVYLFPHDLEQRHEEMLNMVNEHKNEIRERETELKYPNIRRGYRALLNLYLWEFESLLIRPARSAKEIVKEGRELHHCVGGDTYLSKHNRGDSIILFIRHEKTEEVPYITVEMRGQDIVQWYGSHDRKPDKDLIDRWLKEYKKHLKETQEELLQQAAG